MHHFQVCEECTIWQQYVMIILVGEENNSGNICVRLYELLNYSGRCTTLGQDEGSKLEYFQSRWYGS